jgi:hypothetical protein
VEICLDAIRDMATSTQRQHPIAWPIRGDDLLGECAVSAHHFEISGDKPGRATVMAIAVCTCIVRMMITDGKKVLKTTRIVGNNNKIEIRT